MESLETLRTNFRRTAERYAKLIIEEFNLPNNEKILKPVDLSGNADKFIAGGMLFKVSEDFQTRSRRYIFSGLLRPDHLIATKISNNELVAYRALSEYIQNNPDCIINIPMFCTVKYLGYLISAVSLCPINSKTLVYGSSNALRNVQSGEEFPDLLASIDSIANHFNLMEHPVKERSTQNIIQLRFAGDVEVHLGTDGHFYMLDLARFFPSNDKRRAFTYSFRPEFMVREGIMMNPDQFTAFAENPREYHPYGNAGIQRLQEIITTEFWEVIRERQYLPPIVELLREFGLNVRFLGLLRYHCPDDLPNFKIQLLREIILRTVSTSLDFRMRRRNRNHYTDFSSFEAVVEHFINEVSSPESTIWDTSVPNSLLRIIIYKFGTIAIFEEEKNNNLLRIIGAIDEDGEIIDPEFFENLISQLCYTNGQFLTKTKCA
eukprot:TRINITY_DN1743_c0_g1_i2.p1 TRINITY_DN1743_c0_g1~~TRINITY_DN1743_c0_g1_i2.p1  ORF type:complete len:433 (+),score=69.11 TRINITY_DN1743_c0_g1_i2:763-2061(+)